MQTDKIIQHIADWLIEYNQKAGTNGFVVGVSGGIDSAVVSTLCAKSGLPVTCMEMPIHQAENQDSRAHRHVERLMDQYSNVSGERVDLTSTFDHMKSLLPISEKASTDLALANTRARLRMTTLYYFAGIQERLVAGTGNKVEDFGVGFFTKYGDGGVDLSPIADLNKSEVYTLGKALNISDEIRTAPPTDGLFGDDRTDEDQIGATYEELEWAMEFNGSESDVSIRQLEVLGIYHNMHATNSHKMIPIPVCSIPADWR